MQLFCYYTFLATIVCLSGSTAKAADPIQIIPAPVSISVKEGYFHLNSQTAIFYPKGLETWEVPAQYFMALAQPSTGFALEATPLKNSLTIPKPNGIYFVEDKNITQPEGYKLEVRSSEIIISAATAAGAFYAVQTLRQLFPPEINDNVLHRSTTLWSAPCCIIEDYPRFEYRGLHLDVGRHFFPIEFIKKYIDLLALHKMNTFHWHLTDDQGWRMEIKQFSLLQTISSCRTETLAGHYSDSPRKYDGKKHCGYYTQEEIASVIKYAEKRFVTIIPEIEMPGHAIAALAAYPELGCTGGPYAVFKDWGVIDDVFCAGNEKTFEFLDGVLAEVCRVFPGKYIHIGGDECPKARWKACPKCQDRIKKEGLKDEYHLQSYFITRIEKMVEKHGKKIIGWDEILEGGLAPSATVMSWRGTEGGIEAAKASHDVIMTPTTYCYLDYYQSKPDGEPLAIGGYLPIEKVYSFDPMPHELTPAQQRYIKGVQGNLWTEYIATPEQAEYMAYPRAIAIAEIGWSPQEQRSYDDFVKRLVGHFARLDALHVNYARSLFDLKVTNDNGEVRISSLDPQIEIFYTTTGEEPEYGATQYSGPFSLKKSVSLRAAGFIKGKKMGKTIRVDYLMHKAMGKPYKTTYQPEKYTGGGKFGLTNGVTGAMKAWDNWAALPDGLFLDPVIDFGGATEFSTVTTHFVNFKDAWIYPPKSLELLVSADGQHFTSVGKKEYDVLAMKGSSVETAVFELPKGTKGSYLKLVAENFGKIPSGAQGEGNGAWIFLDEIIVE